MSNRTLIDPITLATYIESVLNRLTNAGSTFTAWDVTRQLRDEHSDEEITHADVRDFVHPEMADRIANGTPYDSEFRDYAGQAALTYFPVTQPSQVVIGTVNPVALLPTPNVPTIDWGQD